MKLHAILLAAVVAMPPMTSVDLLGPRLESDDMLENLARGSPSFEAGVP